ncbi:MAG: hypothetical protein NTV01_22560 [Bacteroidia bacterium]|nr:hypothetical protein [Bacteroidia bacterium]
MATIILSHDVKDFAVWKPTYDADSARRSNAGLQEIAVGTKSDNPNKVFMVWKGDPSAVDKMMHDPELAEVMKKSGVISAPEVIVVNS